MKKIILLFVIQAAVICSNAQVKINNSKSTDHIELAGTKASIIPPKDFVVSTQFNGYQQNSSGSSIMVLDIPGPYKEITAGFNEQAMKQKGMELLKKEQVEINGTPGTLLLIKQFSAAHGYAFLKHTLIVGDGESNTFLINAMYPESMDAELNEKLKTAVLTLYVDNSKKISPFDSVDFTVDLTKSAFKIQNSISGTLMLKAADGSMMIIAKSVRAVDATDKKGASLNILKSISSLTYKKLVFSKTVMMDEAEAYQIGAVVDSKGKEVTAVQTTLFGENHHYNITLISPVVTQEIKNDYEYIVQSFKRK